MPLLEDTLFELLPPAESQAWPERFVRAIASGADVSDSVKRWIIWLLNDEASPVYEHVARGAAEQIITLYERRLAGHEPTADKWKSTRLKARAALERHRGATVTEAVCEKPGWDRYAVAVKAPYHACTECGAAPLGLSTRERSEWNEHHESSTRPMADALIALLVKAPTQGPDQSGSQAGPDARERRRGELAETRQRTPRSPSRRGPRRGPERPESRSCRWSTKPESYAVRSWSTRTGRPVATVWRMIPRARHVELGDELIKLHELTPRQAHRGGSIKRLGSGVRRRLGSGQATTATRGERQRSAQRKGAATVPTSRPIGMNDWAGQSLAEGLVDDVRHRVEVRRERARDRLDNRANEVGIRIRMLVVDGRDEVGQLADETAPSRPGRDGQIVRNITGRGFAATAQIGDRGSQPLPDSTAHEHRAADPETARTSARRAASSSDG